MKKFLIKALSIFSLTISVANAQTIANGINDIYAERYQAAKAVFEKLVAANPNDIQATFWLGQAYIGLEDVAGAKSVYDKGLATSANAPLLLVGAGQVDLIQNRINEARQRFETAITMTSSRRGNDPEILNAVGRAIANTYTDREKKGDINFAVQKLEEASQVKTKDNALLADIYVNLGNAYLKAKPGENGGPAFTNYQKAMETNPGFALPAYRMAKLFNTQRNWELYEKYLNDAITRDPKFAPAYYDLAYFKMGKLDLTAAEKYASLFAQSADSDPQNEYLRGSILYAQKKYDEAIAVANSIIGKLGDKTKARVYKLLAYSYADKKDTATAKQNVDTYFQKVQPEDVLALDYKLKAALYLATPGLEDQAYNAVLEGVKADTVLENKVELLKESAIIFRNKGLREKEGDLFVLLMEVKPNFTINEMFDAGRAYYFGQAYTKSRDVFLKFQEKYPEEIYGYEWAFNASRAVDTVRKDSIAVPDALKLFDVSQKDTAKFKRQYLNSAGFLVGYYANDAKDGAKALEYVNKMLVLDPMNETLKGIRTQLETSLQRAPSPRSSSSSLEKQNTSTTAGAGIKPQDAV